MADGAYHKSVICKLSSEDSTTLYCYDIPFVQGIISMTDSDFFSNDRKGKRFAIVLRAALKHLTPKTDSVLNVSSCRESDEKFQQSGGNMNVYLSDDILEKHDLHIGDAVWVKKVNPFPLGRVIVGISSEEGYLWAQKFLAAFLLDNLSSGPVAVRENDDIYLRYDQEKSLTGNKEKECVQMSILQCEPVSQGCITSETSLVITKLTGLEKSLVPKIGETKSLFSSSDSLENFLVSDFTHNLHESLSHDASNDSASSRTHQLRVSILDCEKGSFKDLTCDTSSRVYVSLTTLIDLHLFNGSWVKISANHPRAYCNGKPDKDCIEMSSSSQNKGLCESSPTTGDCHIVQLLAAGSKTEYNHCFGDEDISWICPLANGNEIEDGVLYITPLLHFNLFSKTNLNDDPAPIICISPICNTTLVHDESLTSTKSKSGRPPFATEAHIALVHSPHYKAGDSFDKTLASHFEVSRMLTVGDVFCVLHDWQENSDATKITMAGDDSGLRNLRVYFQVTRLFTESGEVSSCLVDVEYSSLYQRGSVHSYVPSGLESFDSSPSYWEQTSPAGLSPHVDAVENIVKPYLNSRGKQSLPPCGILLSGPAGAGMRTVAKATSKRLNLHIFEVSCYELIGESVAATEARLKNVFQKAIFFSPCILLLRNIHAIGKDKEGNDDEPRIAIAMLECIGSLKEESGWPLVVIATSSSPDDITSDMFSCFLHEVKLEAPSENERYDMLCGLATMTSVGNDVSFGQLAKRTAGLVLADLVALFSHASHAATKRLLVADTEKTKFSAESSSETWFPWKHEQELSTMGVKLCKQDFEDSLEILQSSLSDAIGAPKIPSVRWEDVGGLADVKAEILDTVQLPLQHPELFAAGLRRSGVLLYGPPGTGKTLLAKAVATECSLNFLSVKGPELINMYVGQSEQNVREVFSRAQSARPCVIFFDELDSLAPNRGRSGDSGGVMDRVVSQLLAELDGLHKACDVFVIGATNRPDLLDPALLRPGRFDKLLYLGVSEDRESQLNILRALTRKFSLHPDLRLENVAVLCPTNLTGADFYALCSDAMLQAVKRKIQLLEQGQCDPSKIDDDIQVTEADFQLALEALVPSVSVHELKRYRDLQHQFTLANSGAAKK